MLELSLEPTDDLANPAFKDKASCGVWLQQLQLTNLHQAHRILRSQLQEFNRYPMRGLERLHTLELLSETILFVQTDYAKKLLSKKLPFSDDELSVFVAIIDLWQGLVTGYQRCLQAYLAGDRRLAESGPLLTQRCLRYSGLKIFEHLHNSYEFDPKLWQQLHTLFAFAETQNFQRQSVQDELHSPGHPSSCQAVWVKTLLAGHSHPTELTRGQLQILDRWLTQWSDVIDVDRHCKISGSDAPPLAVDLSSIHGVQAVQLIKTPGDMRYLSMVPLSKLLRVKTILIQQGQSPQQLELGEWSSSDSLELLKILHRHLCETHVDRQAKRRIVAHSADLCFSIEGIYAHIAHKPFRPVKHEVGSGYLAQSQIAAFGRVLTDSNSNATPHGGALEYWHIENESPLGAKVLRDTDQGERIGIHQIVAVRPSDTNTFILGRVSWFLVTLNKQVRMGVQYFPGIAQPIAIKKMGLNASTDKVVAAFLLPEVPALKISASLILPRDFFQQNLLADITALDDKHQTVKMGFSLSKGTDFERVSFSPA
jgi:hypothetical protein